MTQILPKLTNSMRIRSIMAALTTTTAFSTLTSISTFAPTTSAYEVAIIGGGVAGCAAARSLALSTNPPKSVTIYEIGRGPGGRASTRKSRGLPEMRVNHGAPYADIRTKRGLELVNGLGLPKFEGKVGSWTGGTFEEGEGCLHVTGEGNDMSNLAASLLSNSNTKTRYSSMVRGLARENDRWQLFDKGGSLLGSADWLIVAGSGVAHPRWTNTFGGDPPLVAAIQASQLENEKLNRALEAIAKQEASPILAVFWYCVGEEANVWCNLPFAVAELDNDVLSKICVQRLESGACSVVLHSTTEFALQNTGVYGKSSSAARVGDATSDASREDIIIGNMLDALAGVNLPPIPDKCEYGPLLHRWGNAFPKGEALAEELSLCGNNVNVAFCGDYTETDARIGSVEAALLSGTEIGNRIAQHESDKD